MATKVKCGPTEHNYTPTLKYGNSPCPPGNAAVIVVICSRCGDNFTIK